MSVDVRVWDRAGGGEVTLTTGDDNIGHLIGPVDDGFMLWIGAFTNAAANDRPIRRYVGASYTECTDVPSWYEMGIPPYDFFTYTGAACHGTTALLGAFESVDGSVTVHIYRSTNRGMSWTEVFTWQVAFASKGQKFAFAYNGDTEGSWWVNGAENPAVIGQPGVFHSTDDGLTWTFVDTTSMDGTSSPHVSSARRIGDESV